MTSLARILACLLACAAPALAEDVFTAGPRVLFRDYALSDCLALAFPAIAGPAGAAASGYVQYGDGPYEAYVEAERLAHTYLDRTYASIDGADLGVMKCIDFIHGPELEALVTRMIPNKAKPPNFGPSRKPRRR